MVDAAGKVVVGFDASDESQVAVRWAAAVASRRGVPLVVVHAHRVESSRGRRRGEAGQRESTRGEGGRREELADLAAQSAQTVLRQGEEIAREVAPDLQVETAAIGRGAPAALVQLSAQAELVVIGNRGRGRLRGALLGSVAFEVATHATCPVCVVRGALRPLPSMERPIVVGVDGSEGSHQALDEAARLTSETGSYLRVVVCWTPAHENPWHLSSEEEARLLAEQSNAPGSAAGPATTSGGGPSRSTNPWSVSRQELTELDERFDRDEEEAAREIMAEAVQRVRSRYPELTVDQVVRAGRAEEVIAGAATDASLIAVGARGRGDFASLLLGSVSRDVIHSADCAVYVIR